MPQEIVFITGAPGSGKGTQCKRFTQNHPGYVHLSPGDIIRERLENLDTETKNKISRGELLDDQFILDLIKNEMTHFPEAVGFLIDGYPRTIDQATMFDEQVTHSYQTILFDVPSHILQRRLLNRDDHRPDDNADAIKHRLEMFQSKTQPTIEWLKQHSKRFTSIDASGQVTDIAREFNIIIANKAVVNVGLFEFMQLYLSCGNIYNAVNELESRYEANDFAINIYNMALFYIIQSRDDVKRVLASNTDLGPQYHHFDSSHGHRSIVSMQTFEHDNENTRNTEWNNLHKALSSSVSNDKAEIERLVKRHMPLLLRDDSFSLDIAFEDFMVAVWCEYLFGPHVDHNAFRETRKNMLIALQQSFYSSRLKVIPYLGDIACKTYHYFHQEDFIKIDAEFMRYFAQANSGLLERIKTKLSEDYDSSLDDIDKMLLDNIIPLILEMDFVHGALYSSLVEIAKAKIDTTDERKSLYHYGLRESYLFPLRDRIANNDIKLTDATIAKGSHILINLKKSGFYHSSGPRACIGIGVTQWIRDAVFAELKDIILRVDAITYPEERLTRSHSKDVPVAPERLHVRWKYSRAYLQRTLPHYPFKDVPEFYDVLKIFEDPKLTHQIKNRLLRKINKLGLDPADLCIATAEVRGIPIAAMVADALQAPLVTIRKPGKIPGQTKRERYSSAYATDELEISLSSNVSNKKVIFIDDGLASGGSALACCKLIEKLGGEVKSVLTIIDHKYAEEKRDKNALGKYRVRSLFDFQSPRVNHGKSALNNNETKMGPDVAISTHDSKKHK